MGILTVKRLTNHSGYFLNTLVTMSVYGPVVSSECPVLLSGYLENRLGPLRHIEILNDIWYLL